MPTPMFPASRITRGRARPAALIGLALVVATGGTLASPAQAAAWAANTFGPASEQQLFALTNRARAGANRKALAWDNALLEIARWRSRDMAKRNYFSHEIPPNGTLVFDVMSDQGYCYVLAGENIGWNTHPDDVATASIQKAWLKSAGHRSNILSKAWDAMAVGAYKLADGRHYWTVLFADRCEAPPKPPKPAKPRATPVATAAPRATKKPAASPDVKPGTTRPAAATPSPAPSSTPAGTPDAQGPNLPAWEPSEEPTGNALPIASDAPGPARTPAATPVAVPSPIAVPSPTQEIALAPAGAGPDGAGPDGAGPNGGIATATSSPADALRALAASTRPAAGGSGTGTDGPAAGAASETFDVGDPDLSAGVALPGTASLRVSDAVEPPRPADDFLSGLMRFLFGG